MTLRSILQKLVCLLPLLCPAAGHAADMERGAAITDPELLPALDRSELGLAHLLGAPAGSSAAELFALPPMTALRDATDRDFNRYVLDHKDAPDGLVLFDRDALNAPATRFDLAGIVNRMDRAYVSPAECGEIRLIYRPIANHESTAKDAPPSRLPMTFNLVMKARPASAGITCVELARRWLELVDRPVVGTAALTGEGGVFELIRPEAIDRIELNIQVAHESADASDFDSRADYLMKVFRFDSSQKQFKESPLENQIDIERLRADARLAADFRQWLLEPSNFADFDRGTILVPDRFLALSAINETPVRGDGTSAAHDLFPEDDIVAALAKASATVPLQNVLSPAGFSRRLDDITCSGCHRTRAIGGFHFPGRERAGIASGAVVAAASPHFFGDQERRRDILGVFRDGGTPDLSRGFSARPQQRRATELTGTTYVNGWGATCVLPDSGGAPDKSFSSWTCAEGLSCQAAPGALQPRTGFCFPQ